MTQPVMHCEKTKKCDTTGVFPRFSLQEPRVCGRREDLCNHILCQLAIVISHAWQNQHCARVQTKSYHNPNVGNGHPTLKMTGIPIICVFLLTPT